MNQLINRFRRQEPDAQQIIAAALHNGDWRTAALFIVAGSLEVLEDVGPAPAQIKEQTLARTLVLAGQPVTH